MLGAVGRARREAPGAVDDGRWLDGFLFALAGPIYAGTNEIQRNVVADRVLSLAAEHVMRFAFTEDQLLFRTTVREFLDKECTPADVRAAWASATGWSPDRWTKLAALGVTGLTVPEDHGGLGMDELVLVLVLEESGRAALPEPIVATTAVGAPLLRRRGVGGRP